MDPTVIIVALLGALTGGGLLQLLRLFVFKGEESDALVITATQGGVQILNGIVESLHLELERRDYELDLVRGELADCREHRERRG